RQALLLPAWQLPDPGCALLLELDKREHLFDRMRRPVKAAKQPHRLLDPELVGELGVLQLDAQALPQRTALARAPRPTHAEDLDFARVRGGQPFEDLDRGRFAGAVRPEEAEAFARLD